MDSYQHHECARRTKSTYSSVDRDGDDRLGWYFGYQPSKYRRQILRSIRCAQSDPNYNRNSYCYCYTYIYSHRHADARVQANSDTQTPPYSPAQALSPSGQSRIVQCGVSGDDCSARRRGDGWQGNKVGTVESNNIAGVPAAPSCLPAVGRASELTKAPQFRLFSIARPCVSRDAYTAA